MNEREDPEDWTHENARARRLPVGSTRRELLRGSLALSALAMAGCHPTAAKPRHEATPRARVTIRKASARGHANHGWLDTYHTFSFADYNDPRFMGFSSLRVLNQDRVTPGRGFPMHGHRDMEIVSYVLEGVMEHEDTMGNGSRMRPGDVQLMSAGEGVRHSEFNGSGSDGLHFLQMWVTPSARGTKPRYEQKAFTREERAGKLRLVVSPNGSNGSLTIGQDAWLFAGLLNSSDRVQHELRSGNAAWLHVAAGSIRVNGALLDAGDGAALTDGAAVELQGLTNSEVVLWEVLLA